MTLPRILKITFLAAWVLLPGPFALAHQRIDFSSLSTVFEVRKAIEAFHRTYGVYPPQTNWINELLSVGNPAVNINRRKRIFYDEADIIRPIRDGWDNGLVYLLPGIHNPDSFDLYSLGEDGKTESNGDDPDDIASWHSRERFHNYYGLPAWFRQLRYGSSRGAVVIALILIFLASIWTLRLRRVKSSASPTSA